MIDKEIKRHQVVRWVRETEYLSFDDERKTRNMIVRIDVITRCKPCRRNHYVISSLENHDIYYDNANDTSFDKVNCLDYKI